MLQTITTPKKKGKILLCNENYDPFFVSKKERNEICYELEV